MTTAEQWEHLARDANAAAVKAMAEADALRAELAALRAADGQEKPNGALAFEDIACAACGAVGEFHHIPATPVGGQAEPSDAQIEAAYSVGYAAMRYDSATWFDSLRKAVPDMLRAAAAVSGEQP